MQRKTIKIMHVDFLRIPFENHFYVNSYENIAVFVEK